MIVQAITSRLVIITKAKSLDLVKLLSQPNIQSLKFLFYHWNTICYPFHSFVRWVRILFTNKGVIVCRRSDGSFAFKDVLKGKLYLMDFIPEEMEFDKCLIAKTNMGWLWHRRLAHVGTRNLYKLQKDGHILGLTNIIFKKDRPCGACQAEKQVGAHHHIKNIKTTIRPLEMLHMDLFGPITYISISGNKYGLVIVDDYSRFIWVFFL
jgi:hypothetical protein